MGDEPPVASLTASTSNGRSAGVLCAAPTNQSKGESDADQPTVFSEF